MKKNKDIKNDVSYHILKKLKGHIAFAFVYSFVRLFIRTCIRSSHLLVVLIA